MNASVIWDWNGTLLDDVDVCVASVNRLLTRRNLEPMTVERYHRIFTFPVQRPAVTETTALGAAYLAGLAVGYWSGLDEIAAQWWIDAEFEPAMSAERRDVLYAGWQRAVERARDWAVQE